MPITPTYPGVYVEEVPSSVRTVVGVATSIAAFVGLAARGPVNRPVTINSYSDFERIFGGLSLDSPMSYAVRDFYLNGGSQAVIVRLFRPFFATSAEREASATAAASVSDAAANATPSNGALTPADVVRAAQARADQLNGTPGDPAANAVAAAAAAAAEGNGDVAAVRLAAREAAAAAAPVVKAQLSVGRADAGQLQLEAAYEGAWANQLRARVDHDTRPRDDGSPDPNLFNLTLRDSATGVVEQFRNVAVAANDPRRVDRVLLNESRLARVRGTLPTDPPAAHPAPRPGEDVWKDRKKVNAADPEPEQLSSKVPADGENPGTARESAPLRENDLVGADLEGRKQGIYALEHVDLFNLLCLPPLTLDGETSQTIVERAVAYCEKRRALLLVDPKAGWNDKDAVRNAISNNELGAPHKNAALFFPRIRQPNPLRDNQVEEFVPCGAIAGVFARTDAERGVWKAPAGLDASVRGVQELEVRLTDLENGELNPLGVNCLRTFPIIGTVVWGARTMRGADRLADQWKYVPVRRLALYIEESLYRGTQWVVFEPNDEPLWSAIRLNVGAFMNTLFRQGAFQGRSPREAYLVKCDQENNPQADIDRGIVNILVGFAPLKPAEFVMIQIQQRSPLPEA
jgi:phage tail sheath protein FI